MQALGDDRPLATILRGIHRMLAGEIRVSGEMIALTKMMLRERRRVLYRHSKAAWHRLSNGSYTARVEGFRATLFPESRERWRVEIAHEGTGYIHPWPRFQKGLAAAQRKALITIDDAMDYLLEEDLIAPKRA